MMTFSFQQTLPLKLWSSHLSTTSKIRTCWRRWTMPQRRRTSQRHRVSVSEAQELLTHLLPWSKDMRPLLNFLEHFLAPCAGKSSSGKRACTNIANWNINLTTITNFRVLRVPHEELGSENQLRRSEVIVGLRQRVRDFEKTKEHGKRYPGIQLGFPWRLPLFKVLAPRASHARNGSVKNIFVVYEIMFVL